jgi:hypothetical protein
MQTMALDQTMLDRADTLAVELIDICRAAGKPLAGDFVRAAIDYLVAGSDCVSRIDQFPDPKEARFHES